AVLGRAWGCSSPALCQRSAPRISRSRQQVWARPRDRPHTAVGLAWYASRSAYPRLGATSMGHFDPTQKSQAASEEKLKAYACELEHKLEARTRELSEAREQQAATSEILRVIRGSPNNVQPVFDAVAESAARLCESFDSAVWRRESD